MRAGGYSKLIAALLAPALFASGAGQGLLFMRCGSTVRMSCCCPKDAPPAPASTVSLGTQTCCDKLAVPALPPQNLERAVPTMSAPVLVSALGPAPIGEPIDERIRQIPRLEPLPGPSLALANCALLI